MKLLACELGRGTGQALALRAHPFPVHWQGLTSPLKRDRHFAAKLPIAQVAALTLATGTSAEFQRLRGRAPGTETGAL